MTRFTTLVSKTPLIKQLVAVGLAVWMPVLALADGPVSSSEQASVVAAIAKEGCSGGRIEKDDGGYEVDNATCDGTPNFDIYLDSSFKVVSKQKDD